ELVRRGIVARPHQPGGQLVQGEVGARRPHRRELGHEGERQATGRRASAAGEQREGHHVLGHPNTYCNSRVCRRRNRSATHSPSPRRAASRKSCAANALATSSPSWASSPLATSASGGGPSKPSAATCSSSGRRRL